MDDLAQFSQRRRALAYDPTPPFPTPIRFRLGPRVPLPARRRDPHAWRPRLGLR